MVNTASSPSRRLGLFVRELPSAAQPPLACYAIRTAPRAERACLSCLAVLGAEPIFFSFFPRFVFGRFHPVQRSSILSIPGVESIVSFAQLPSGAPLEKTATPMTVPTPVNLPAAGNLPVPVNEDELFAIQSVAHCRLPLSPAPFPAEGFAAEVRGGPLKGLRGRVCGPSTEPYLIVSLSLLQRSIAVRLEPDWVWPLGDRDADT
jgi:hypothetical protein